MKIIGSLRGVDFEYPSVKSKDDKGGVPIRCEDAEEDFTVIQLSDTTSIERLNTSITSGAQFFFLHHGCKKRWSCSKICHMGQLACLSKAAHL
jgi:hypothetical protein